MESQLLRMFQRQAHVQCEFLLLAAEDLQSARGEHRVWFALENLFAAAANLSKAFWGLRGAKAEEREALRQSVGVCDDSALRDMGMRNHFEHFDERIDRWWAESPDHNVADMNIGLGPQLPFPDIDKFRNFMPQTQDVWFWGERYDLVAVVTEARALLPKLRAEAMKASWE